MSFKLENILFERIKRKNTLFQFGFGVDLMKSSTVCTQCRSLENIRNMMCSKCGSKLPGANLYDYYRAQHRSCPECGSVLADAMNYCPKCGISVKELKAL